MVLDADRPLSLLELEELRIAADEACILIMDNCGPQQGTVDCCFDELADGIVMEIRAATDTARRAPPWIDVDSFGWTLLDALVDSLFWEADATSIAIHVTKHASPVPPPGCRPRMPTCIAGPRALLPSCFRRSGPRLMPTEQAQREAPWRRAQPFVSVAPYADGSERAGPIR